jgi:hypothetical protein
MLLGAPVWRGRLPLAMFAVGLVIGAVASASVVLLVGSLVRPLAPEVAVRAVLAVAVFAVILREMNLVSFWLPQNKRLVPEEVLRHGRVFGPIQFGFEMGTSVRTYIPSGWPHVLALSIALLATVPYAAAAGVAFALGRATMSIGNVRLGGEGEWDVQWLRHERLIRLLLSAAFVVAMVVVAL